jgi:glycosyltransferase involved in cell wall biosynthesis
MGLEVVLVGANLEGPNFWEGVDTRMAGPDWLDGVSLVVQPAVVEDSPRRLLAALAAGVPVVATPACGLDQQPGLTLIGPNDTKALVAAIRQALAKGEGTASPMEAMA